MIWIAFLWLLSNQRHSAAAREPSVVQGDLIHYHDKQFGSFVPMVELGLGDGSQKILAQIDSGSADLALARKASSICDKHRDSCRDIPTGAGAFDPFGDSETQLLDIPFTSSYVSGETFWGGFVKTQVCLGNNTIPRAQIGLYSEGEQPPGVPLFPIFGTGPPQGNALEDVYPNVPEQMKIAGIIKTNAYGLYMNDFRGTNGQVVFGGIDIAKFEGKLQEAPDIGDSGGRADIIVEMSSIKFFPGTLGGRPRPGSNQGGAYETVDLSAGKALPPALLDTGAPDICLPKAAVQLLAKALGVEFDDQDGIGYVDCSLVHSGAAIQFGFNHDRAKIRLPLDMLLEPRSILGHDRCLLAVSIAEGADQDLATLGAAMMQAAYVVFDNDQRRLLLAQAKPNVTDSAIRELPSPPREAQRDCISGCERGQGRGGRNRKQRSGRRRSLGKRQQRQRRRRRIRTRWDKI